MINRLLIFAVTVGTIACFSDEIQTCFDNILAYARYEATSFEMKNLATVMQCYYASEGRYPENFEEVVKTTFLR